MPLKIHSPEEFKYRLAETLREERIKNGYKTVYELSEAMGFPVGWRRGRRALPVRGWQHHGHNALPAGIRLCQWQENKKTDVPAASSRTGD